MTANDHVVLEDGDWWFWDEIWLDRYGPFESKEQAREFEETYCREVLLIEPAKTAEI